MWATEDILYSLCLRIECNACWPAHGLWWRVNLLGSYPTESSIWIVKLHNKVRTGILCTFRLLKLLLYIRSPSACLMLYVLVNVMTHFAQNCVTPCAGALFELQI